MYITARHYKNNILYNKLRINFICAPLSTPNYVKVPQKKKKINNLVPRRYPR